jgi:hypothetical protein
MMRDGAPCRACGGFPLSRTCGSEACRRFNKFSSSPSQILIQLSQKNLFTIFIPRYCVSYQSWFFDPSMPLGRCHLSSALAETQTFPPASAAFNRTLLKALRTVAMTKLRAASTAPHELHMMPNTGFASQKQRAQFAQVRAFR